MESTDSVSGELLRVPVEDDDCLNAFEDEDGSDDGDDSDVLDDGLWNDWTTTESSSCTSSRVFARSIMSLGESSGNVFPTPLQDVPRKSLKAVLSIENQFYHLLKLLFNPSSSSSLSGSSGFVNCL